MKKVLIAEDSAVLQNVIKRILGGSYEIKAVKNGEAVLKEIEKTAYDVILLDINMPKMNGIDCAKAIRANADSDKAKTSIVAITGNAMNYSEEQFKEVGIDEILLKPIDFDALVAVVKKYVD